MEAFKERGRSPTRRGGDFFVKVPADASTDESVDRGRLRSKSRPSLGRHRSKSRKPDERVNLCDEVSSSKLISHN